MKANVVQGAFKPRRWWQGKWVVGGLITVVVVAAGVTATALVVHHRNEQRAAKAQQASLQAQLTQAVFGTHNDRATISTATSLINGVASKRFSLSSTQLAQVYLDRAAAYSNVSEFTPALADYQKAIATDGSVKIGALQGELLILSQQHNSKAMVPILQQLVPLLRSSQMPNALTTAAQYEAAITDIQNGQEVSF